MTIERHDPCGRDETLSYDLDLTEANQREVMLAAEAGMRAGMETRHMIARARITPFPHQLTGLITTGIMRGLSLYGESKPIGTDEEQTFQVQAGDASLPLIHNMIRISAPFIPPDTNSLGLDEEALHEGISVGLRLRAYIDETRLCDKLQAVKRSVFIGRMAEQIILDGDTVTPKIDGKPLEIAGKLGATDNLRGILTDLFVINTIPPQQAEYHEEE
jgi:hypothetical protein